MKCIPVLFLSAIASMACSKSHEGETNTTTTTGASTPGATDLADRQVTDEVERGLAADPTP